MIAPLIPRIKAAEILHIHPRTLDQYAKQGMITPSKYGGCVMYTEKNLQAFIDAHTVPVKQALTAPDPSPRGRRVRQPEAVPPAASGGP